MNELLSTTNSLKRAATRKPFSARFELRKMLGARHGQRWSSNLFRLTLALIAAMSVSGCVNYLPNDGPQTSAVKAAATSPSLQGIEIVPVNYAIANKLTQESEDRTFASMFIGGKHDAQQVAPGDELNVFIWEAQPTMLFTPGQGSDANSTGTTGAAGSSMVALPTQAVDDAGDIMVPFAGQIYVAGLTPSEISARITAQLQGKANQPQVLVQLSTNTSHDVTVVGDVLHSMEVPIEPGGVRLLRALAEAGGVTDPVEQVSIQLSRNGQEDTLPLETILLNPDDNIFLQPGDVITAMSQPLQVTMLGATGNNKVVNFSKGNASLAEMLANAGGLRDLTANPTGVFVFRFVDPNALAWSAPPKLLVQGKVPVVFQFDLRDPATLFAAQEFQMDNKDLVYVSDAPATNIQKVLNVVGAIVYPFSTMYTYGLDR